MKILFVMDAIKSLNPKSDTSLRIAREFQARRHQVYATTFENLIWEDDRLFARVEKLEKIVAGKLPGVSRKSKFKIGDFKIILIRKDPPFDRSYVNLCWLLAPYEKKIFISNAPSLLLRHHEKMLPLEAARDGYLKLSDIVPTFISQDRDSIVDYVKRLRSDEIILKPFYGFAGHEIRKVSKEHFLAAPADYLTHHQDVMVQPFLPEIRSEGDRRVFMIGGKYKGSFVRIPQGTSIISNLARGGRAELRKLSAGQKRVVGRVEKYLRQLKIDCAGVDLIGTRVGEINITSPTGFIAYETMTGINLAKSLVDLFLRKVKR